MKDVPLESVVDLEDIPNIGPSIADDLRGLGVTTPRKLAGRDPRKLYEKLNRDTGIRHDPCVLDCFMAAVDFMETGVTKPWWDFTAQRKRMLAGDE